MQVMTCLEGYTQYHISKGPSNGSRKIKDKKMEIVFILIRKLFTQNIIGLKLLNLIVHG